MGNFKCRILEHSVNVVGDEVVTYELCYERFVHQEVLTHCSFNRNSSSSRAIPYEKMKGWIARDPAMPVHLGRNQKGMQSGGEVDEPEGAARSLLDLHSLVQHECDRIYARYGLHKEIINRYTEPWGWINTVLSTGRPGLMNFFSLRMSPYAHPNFQRLAVAMARAYRASRARLLLPGEWHLPYTDDLDGKAPIDEARVWSVARCAWVSYRTVDGRPATYGDAKRRHDDCVNLKHATPCGHQFRARDDHGRNGGQVAGFDQYRHMIPGESVPDFDYEALLDGAYADRDFIIPE